MSIREFVVELCLEIASSTDHGLAHGCVVGRLWNVSSFFWIGELACWAEIFVERFLLCCWRGLR